MGISRRRYAEHRGVSEKAVRKAIAAGRIRVEPDGSIDPAKADGEWARQTDPAMQRGPHSHRQGSRDGAQLGNIVSARITYANNLDRIETIRDDGMIDGADPAMAALSGTIDVRFADQALMNQAIDGAPAELEFGYRIDASTAFTLTAHAVYLPRPRVIESPGGQLALCGVNQGNRVSDQPYPMSRIVAVRRAEPDTPASSNRPVLRHGDRGVFVEDLQEQLIALRYPIGRVDRIFGDRTRAAVLAFQADQGLKPDGVVGRETWAALATAEPRPEREVTAQDLREEGSRTIRRADGAQAGTGIAIVIGGVTLTMESFDDALSALEQAEGLLERMTVLVESFWPILLIAAVGVAVWQLLDGIKRARVEDARGNRNLGR